MNTFIELHDSELKTVSHRDGTAVLHFSPAYLHRSEGRPGVDPGSVWLQDLTLTLTDATLEGVSELPAGVSEGATQAGGHVWDNGIPGQGVYSGPVLVTLLLSTGVTLAVRGDSLTVAFHGEPRYLEEFRS